MIGRKKIIIGITTLFLGFILWEVFMPTYNYYYYYSFENCKDTHLTILVYRNLRERSLILANGIYKKMPENKFIKSPDFNGFDEIFDCMATCNNGVIIINYYTGYFDIKSASNSIKTRRVNNDEYDSLRSVFGAKDIRLF